MTAPSGAQRGLAGLNDADGQAVGFQGFGEATGLYGAVAFKDAVHGRYPEPCAPERLLVTQAGVNRRLDGVQDEVFRVLFGFHGRQPRPWRRKVYLLTMSICGHDTAMTKQYTIQGISDEVTTCDCCGKSNLKRTVCLQPADGTGAVYFGVNCAAQAMSIKGRYTARTAGTFVQAVKARDEAKAARDAVCARAQAEANRTGRPYALIRSWGKISGRGFYTIGMVGAPLRCDYLVTEDIIQTFQPV